MVAAAIVVAAILMFGGSGAYTVHADFINAGQLVRNDQVMVGWRPVGLITKISLTDSGQRFLGDAEPLIKEIRERLERWARPELQEELAGVNEEFRRLARELHRRPELGGLSGRRPPGHRALPLPQ